MVNVGGAANLVAAIIEQARRDAVEPKNCRSVEAPLLRRDALEFMLMIDQIRADLLQDVVVPYRPQHRAATGATRWEMTASDLKTQKRLSAQRRKREKAGNNDAGRK